MSILANLDGTWREKLLEEFSKSYMIELEKFLFIEKENNKIIYPHDDCIFNCFAFTKFDNVKVVILGQDPYSGENQAHGLSFSVLPGIRIPMSLKNIYKELYYDLNIQPSKSGCLIDWSKQGVLLLNSILTVEKSKPQSHANIGWEFFTDKVIEILSSLDKRIIFVLWGNYAISKVKNIDLNKHFIIKSSHPSPYSANNGFFGTRPFSKINNYLKFIGESIIDWRII
ncbi:MAG TPA: uracil-DNA glycosylase [Candidatus Azoamicus sp. OHIO1]